MSLNRSQRLGWVLALAGVLLAGGPLAAQTAPAGAAPRELSLEQALGLAAGTSESVSLARAGVTTAEGQQISARAERLPQISSSLSYSRTLINQFSGAGGAPTGDSTSQVVPCSSFATDPSRPLEERVSLLEQTVGCSTASPGGGLDLGRAGFGAANTYNLGLSASQTLYSGGRISAQNRIAEAGLRSAELEVTEQNAQSLVTVAQRYYDAVLADRLLEIAEASLAQTEETLRLAELAFQVGDKAEYDVLRARVARTNQSNAVVQQRSSRDLAYTALKQQLELPVDQPLTLTTPLGDSVVPEVTLPASAAAALDTATAARVAVRQAEEAVRMQEGQVQLTRAQSRPSVTISSSYALSAYPPDVIPTADAFQDNWSVSLGVSIPIFDGGRVRGSVVQAQGALEQARVQLQQTRESAVLDVRTKQETLERARSSLQAMVGAVEEAQRAYEIAQLRYQQGLSSLTEVNDTRLALNQAQADRAQAARDLYVAELQLLLVRDLPLDTTGAASQGAAQARSTGSAAQARPAATSFSPNP